MRSVLLGDEIQTARSIREWVSRLRRERICSRLRTATSHPLAANIEPFSVDSASNIEIYVIIGNNRHFTALRNGSEIRPWQLLYFSYHFIYLSLGEKPLPLITIEAKLKKKKKHQRAIADGRIPHTYFPTWLETLSSPRKFYLASQPRTMSS